MSTTTSPVESSPAASHSRATQTLAAAEILAVFSGILLYIWRWQYSHPRYWIPMLAFVLAGHLVHRDSLRDLGLTAHAMRESAQIVLPVALAILLPALVYGLAAGRLHPEPAGSKALGYFGVYLVWCAFQQYLTQSFFHNRLMHIVKNRHASSALVAVMFGAAHIPNPILMAVTTLGGFVFAEIFARHRNIWPLVLAQAVSGALLAALAPAALIHNMRVGPGYFFFGQS
jgi:Type II CAAX prenyl endopeptidase Rce1-like